LEDCGIAEVHVHFDRFVAVYILDDVKLRSRQCCKVRRGDALCGQSVGTVHLLGGLLVCWSASM